MTLRNKQFLSYAAKCVTGVLLIYPIKIYLGQWIDYPWSLLSVVLVMSPEGKDAVELALTRIKANLVGAMVGLAMLLTALGSPWDIALGSAFSLFACDRLKLNEGARSTLAAMIIILLHPEGTHPWDTALNRVLAVAVGSLMGLGITLAFHFFIRMEGKTKAHEE